MKNINRHSDTLPFDHSGQTGQPLYSFGVFIMKEKQLSIWEADNSTHVGKTPWKTNLSRLREGIIDRCSNPNRKEYPKYGGRGIKICDEWKNDRYSFFSWANQNGYRHGLEIDRINNDGDYCPDNCRFVTHSFNNRNKGLRSDSSTGYMGISKHTTNDCFVSEIQYEGKRFRKSGFKTATEAAKYRDKFITENNLTGFNLNKYE